MGFAAASAVTPAGEGTWSAGIAPGWDVSGKAHGGYLLAIAARAAAAACRRPDPVSVTGHFLRPGRPGPVTVTTEVVHRGRRFSTVRAAVEGGGATLLAILGTFSDPTEQAGPVRLAGSPPLLPPPEQCVRLGLGDPFPRVFNERVDLRLPAEDAALTPMEGPLRLAGWFRFPDAEPVDPFGLLVAVDAFLPAAWRSDLAAAWTPTLGLTVHVRARPAPGWLRGAFTTRFITGGYLEEDGELWDSAGRLVAQSRQLALVPRP